MPGGPLAADLRPTHSDREQALAERHESALRYIREKTNQLLRVMGTVALRPEELDDETLLELDPIGIVSDSFVQVLSHLHETNAGLQAAHGEIDAIFRTVGVGILVLDRDYRIVAFNERQREHVLAGVDEPVGRRCYEVVCGLGAPPAECILRTVLEREDGARVPGWRIRDRHYDIVGTPMRDPAGRISHVVVAYNDVTDRLRAEKALRESEERYRDLFENASDLIQSVRPDGSFLFVNRAWRETLGYTEDEIAGLTVSDVIHADCAEHCGAVFQRVLAGEAIKGIEARFRTRGGRSVLLEGSASCSFEGGRPVATRGIFRDVTEKRRMEEELRKVQRLESVGLLAGGIAHDFNNLLTGILTNLSAAQLPSGAGEDRHERLREAEKATLRARDLTRQLLTFSRGGEPMKKPFDSAHLARESAALALAGRRSGCRVEAGEDLWPADGDEGQIGQVLRNLLVNADQAMGAGGTVEIRCENVTPSLAGGIPLVPGRYVKITVTDEGSGIAPENLERVFDPYFTTKTGGSGLGLAVTYSVVTKHGGHVEVSSRPGEGAAFSLYLPAAEASSSPASPTEQDREDLGGAGKILVMDDEEFIREATFEILTDLGYHVHVARDGREAIEIYQRARGEGVPFDVVVMDLTIPGGMGGQEAIGKLRALDPGVRAIVSSGYANDPVMANFRDHGFDNVVAKPYTVTALVDTLKAVLRSEQ
jgi:PAS domain S-box-containing protein